MTATLAELEERVQALEGSRPGDLRTAVTTMQHLDETRLRMSAVEARLDGLSQALGQLTASQAQMRGELNTKIDAVRTELNGKIDGLRRDMPGIVADALREVMRGNKG
jgi:hypothetical protein